MKTNNLVQHDKTKHVKLDKHSINEKIEDSSIELPFVKSEDQLADIFTKAVTGKTFTRVLSKLSLMISLLTLRGSVRILLLWKQIKSVEYQR